MEDLVIGSRVEHERYGEGIVSQVGFTNYTIIFVRGGEMQFSKSNDELSLLERGEGQAEAGAVPTFSDVEEMLIGVLERYNGIEFKVELGDKWDGGTMVLKPGNADLQSKEIPIDTFFHKLVMVRDRLRVLEQNINSHAKLEDEDKVNLQQYISRIYGSLTTFNVLFADKADYFKSK